MKKNLLLSIALVLISLPVFAGSSDGSGPVLPFNDAVAAFSVTEPYVPRTIPGKTIGRRPNVGAMIMAGVLGNIVGSLAGLYLGAGLSGDEDNLGPVILGWGAGSAFGSATGVILAGNSQYWQGSFGMAMIGGVLGSGLACCIVSLPVFQRNASILSLTPLLVVPPIVAAIFYNSSLRPRLLPAGNALLNFSDSRLGLGVPGIQVRPLPVHMKNMKPELQFTVRVLSFEL